VSQETCHQVKIVVAGGATEGNEMTASTIALGKARTAVWTAALPALLVGVFLVYLVGLAQPMVLHNAAHDTRHSLSFPCH
jgi:cobalt transporter subunit CbtB